MEFAEVCARGERYVGIKDGGMDQAIEVLANEGPAMQIDFGPLNFAPVSLPESALFAVFHSGEILSKAATFQYNECVVECRLAAQLFLVSPPVKFHVVLELLKQGFLYIYTYFLFSLSNTCCISSFVLFLQKIASWGDHVSPCRFVPTRRCDEFLLAGF